MTEQDCYIKIWGYELLLTVEHYKKGKENEKTN